MSCSDDRSASERKREGEGHPRGRQRLVFGEEKIRACDEGRARPHIAAQSSALGLINPHDLIILGSLGCFATEANELLLTLLLGCLFSSDLRRQGFFLGQALRFLLSQCSSFRFGSGLLDGIALGLRCRIGLNGKVSPEDFGAVELRCPPRGQARYYKILSGPLAGAFMEDQQQDQFYLWSPRFVAAHGPACLKASQE